jgi:hypothetical protein
MQIDRGKSANSGLHGLDRAAGRGGHSPWSGVGHVDEEKDEFRYFPEATK